MKAAVLILAAGASTRMGVAKQLLPYKGLSLLGHVVKAALDADCGPVFAVLGANSDAIRESLNATDVRFVLNAGWASGMGSSIGAGVAAILEQIPDLAALLVLLGDQPFIDAALIRRFFETSKRESEKIIAAAYDGTLGVPAVFPGKYFGELRKLNPAKGAKPLLERHAADIELIALETNPDIDTPEVYRNLIGGC